MHLLQRILEIYLKSSFYINGFLTIPRLPWLSALIRICYLSWLSAVVFLMFYWRMNGGDTSVGGLVGTASFLLNGSVNIIIILETIFKHKHYKKMCKLQHEVDELLHQHLNVQENMKYTCLTKCLAIILLCQLVCDGLKMWINCISKISPVFWYLLPITVNLRTRYIQIIYTIMTLNHRIRILRDAITSTAKDNEPKSKFSSDIWRPYDPKEYEKVNYMRLIYLRMWEVYMSFNNLYSWSLLTLFMSSFFDIVCNCYWTFTAIYKRQVFHKYVMNGATSFSLASLVYVLFYFTDASEHNGNFNMPASVFNKVYSYHKQKIYKTAIILMYLCYWTFGLAPFTKNYRVFQAFIVLWYCEIAWATYLAISYDVFGDEHSLNGLVSVILYFTHMLGHLTVLAESCNMRKQRSALFEQFSKIKIALEVELKNPYHADISVQRLSISIIGVLVLLSCGHGIIMWTTFKTKSAASLLYWRSLLSYLALQLKTLEFLTPVVQLSYYTIVMRKALNNMGERNLRRVFKSLNKCDRSEVIIVASLHEEEEDEKLLVVLKNCYNEIYATIRLYNEAYGWSLLASTAVYFVDFVCNCYWILLAVLSQGRDYYGLLQNAAFALLAFILLSILCWFAEECYYESRYIGCLISKLVKPLGNKYYNDLVSEFSVQTLHQRFIITAKEFFSLNLSLLGSMVAAIVTYLVILIQFMFTEKSNNENRLTTKATVLASTTPAAFEIISNMETSKYSSILKGLIENVTTKTNNTVTN